MSTVPAYSSQIYKYTNQSMPNVVIAKLTFASPLVFQRNVFFTDLGSGFRVWRSGIRRQGNESICMPIRFGKRACRGLTYVRQLRAPKNLTCDLVTDDYYLGIIE